MPLTELEQKVLANVNSLIQDYGYEVYHGNQCLTLPEYLLKFQISYQLAKELENSLFLAIRAHNDQAIDFLLRKIGIDANIQDTKGDTPLHYAVRRNDKSLVERLLTEGADPFIKNNLNRTPIGYALGNSELILLFEKYHFGIEEALFQLSLTSIHQGQLEIGKSLRIMAAELGQEDAQRIGATYPDSNKALPSSDLLRSSIFSLLSQVKNMEPQVQEAEAAEEGLNSYKGAL